MIGRRPSAALLLMLAVVASVAATEYGPAVPVTWGSTGVAISFTVPPSADLTNAVLNFHITDNGGNLNSYTLRLLSPQGTEETLMVPGQCTSGDLYGLFDHYDTDAFACPPRGKTLPPSGDMSNFIGEDPTGTWTFTILSGGGTGSLDILTLDVQCCDAFMVQTVDLNRWSNGPEDIGASTPGNWVVSSPGGNQQVDQTVNTSLPSYFDSDFYNVYGLQLTATLRNTVNSDDDFIGFALGRGTGNGYFVIQWKRTDQNVGGCNHLKGMELVHVEDTEAPFPSQNDFWCAGVNQASGPTNKVLHVAYGLNGFGNGGTGWQPFVDYSFAFTMTSTTLVVSVATNGGAFVEVFNLSTADLPGRPWPNGKYSFMNHSQPNVRYSGVTATYSATATAGCSADGAQIDVPFSGYGCYNPPFDIASLTIDWNDTPNTVDSGVGLLSDFSTGVGGTISGSHSYSSPSPGNPEVCVRGGGGCSGETCIDVILNITPPVSVVFSTPCPSPPILDVEMNGGNPPFTYQWSSEFATDPPQMTTTTQDQNAVSPPIPPGRYTVVASDSNNCDSTGEFVLRFQVLPTSDSDIYLCGTFNPTATYNLLIRILDSYTCGNLHTYSVDWGDGSATETGPLDSFSNRFTGQKATSHTYVAFGSYTVTYCVTVDNSDGTKPSGSLGCQSFVISVVSAHGRVILPPQDDTFYMYIKRDVTWELNAPGNSDTTAEIQLRNADGSSIIEVLQTVSIQSGAGIWAPGPHDMFPGSYSIWVVAQPSQCVFDDPRYFELVPSPHNPYP